MIDKSIQLDDKYKTYVLTDIDFEGLLEHPKFIELTS